MPHPKCSFVKGKGIVCGQLHSGGSVPSRGGVYRLAKGEKVFSKTALNKLAKGSKKKHATKQKESPLYSTTPM
jgi:hypothetical protein